MKGNRIFRILALVIILSLLFLSIPAVPAAAQITACTPISGTVGSPVAVQGSGFIAYEGQWVHIFFNLTRVYSVQVAGGAFYAPFNIPTGAASPGTVLITVRTSDIYGAGLQIGVTSFTLTQSATIAIIPTTGNTGATVTVSGTNFTSSSTITITFDNNILVTATSDATGAFTGATFTVPESYKGSHVVKATDVTGNLDTKTFSITQSATLASTSGEIGDSVTISGNGFQANKPITIKFDNVRVYDTEPESITTDANGSFSATFNIPDSDRGSHTIQVSDGTYTYSSDLTVIIPVTFSIDKTSGVIGNEFAVSGTGFAKYSNVEVFFAGDKIGEAVADSDGSFNKKFAVPATTSGTYVVEVTDDTYTKSAEFTIPPHSASFSKNKGRGGTEVEVSGTNFTANTSVTFTFDGEKQGGTTTNAKGSFSEEFTIPSSKKGTYEMVISDGFHTESAEFTVEVNASLDTTEGHIYTEVTASGTGFNGEVTIKYDAAKVATTTAKDDGTFSANFRVPVSEGGNHTITVSDSFNTMQFTFVMESDAPPVPKLLLPQDDVKAEATGVLFDWEDVTDPSGVIYVFQLASDPDFKSILLQKEAMTETQYTITEAEELESTKKDAPYYWRVKAIDGASNESAWSTPRTFHVGFTFGLPDWAKYVLIALGALLIGVVGFLLGRRSAYSY